MLILVGTGGHFFFWTFTLMILDINSKNKKFICTKQMGGKKNQIIFSMMRTCKAMMKKNLLSKPDNSKKNFVGKKTLFLPHEYITFLCYKTVNSKLFETTLV